MNRSRSARKLLSIFFNCFATSFSVHIYELLWCFLNKLMERKGQTSLPMDLTVCCKWKFAPLIWGHERQWWWKPFPVGFPMIKLNTHTHTQFPLSRGTWEPDNMMPHKQNFRVTGSRWGTPQNMNVLHFSSLIFLFLLNSILFFSVLS